MKIVFHFSLMNTFKEYSYFFFFFFLKVSTLRGELTTSREELAEYKTKAGRILQSKEKLIASLKEDRGAGKEGSIAGDPEGDIHQAELLQIRQVDTNCNFVS